MDFILKIVTQTYSKRYEEDIIDRGNYQLTAYIFAFSTAIITTYTYMASPITCWTPAEFRGGWTQYTNDYCFVENTYYVPMSDPSMPDHYTREKTELPYYQWVQFVLVLLAFCFFLPHLFWRSLNWWSGVQIRAIVGACSTLSGDNQKKQAELEKVVNHIYRTIYTRKMPPPSVRYEKTIFSTNWSTKVYFVMKILFLINIVFQLIILHHFLGFNWLDLYSLRLGFQSDWQNTGLFPRSTMCDFEIRNKGNIQRYSVQCVLIQNMLNEKVFLVLFYWLMILFIATLGNTIIWVYQMFENNRRDFVARMLQSAGVKEEFKDFSERKKFDQFINVTPDMLLLLRLISSNAGDSVCCDVIKLLYTKAQAEDE